VVWTIEQVEAIAPSPAAMTAARTVATIRHWDRAAVDERTLWGSFRGTAAEPYTVMVDHIDVAFSCTCPSRRTPCKHALGLLVLWVDGAIAAGLRPPELSRWMEARQAKSGAGVPSGDGTTTASSPNASEHGQDDRVDTGADDRRPPEPSADDPDRDSGRDDRVARMHAGLDELDRWLDDRIRTGLADPALARYGTWDTLAARLVDARAGSLANRIRRLAGVVGASPRWHEEVLEEIGVLHLLSQGGRRLGSLPGSLADTTAVALGWQVRTAEVLAGVPDTDTWIVAGRSDRREDRIEVRRVWLRAVESGRWALVLSFAAYRQSLDTSLPVGASFVADLHRYPGRSLRAIVGRREPDSGNDRPPATDVATACTDIGAMLAAEPWLDRVPATVTATPCRSDSGAGEWALTDATGSIPISGESTAGPSGAEQLMALIAVAGGSAVDVTVEWTPHGVIPLTLHLEDRAVDIGPVADPSFVGAA
jgi:hypothetical protein